MSTGRVVVVGGGFAGLSAAYTLMKRGITPLLLEAGERAGGRGKGERVDGKVELRFRSPPPSGKFAVQSTQAHQALAPRVRGLHVDEVVARRELRP